MQKAELNYGFVMKSELAKFSYGDAIAFRDWIGKEKQTSSSKLWFVSMSVD